MAETEKSTKWVTPTPVQGLQLTSLLSSFISTRSGAMARARRALRGQAVLRALLHWPCPAAMASIGLMSSTRVTGRRLLHPRSTIWGIQLHTSSIRHLFRNIADADFCNMTDVN